MHQSSSGEQSRAAAIGEDRWGVNAVWRAFGFDQGYTRVKGEVEASLRLLDFPAGLKIFRPSLLLGERSERRPAERAMMAFMGATTGLFRGRFTRYRAIAAAAVARAMVYAALEPERPGVLTYEGEALFKMARAGAPPSTSGTRA